MFCLSVVHSSFVPLFVNVVILFVYFCLVGQEFGAFFVSCSVVASAVGTSLAVGHESVVAIVMVVSLATVGAYLLSGRARSS